jgi:zinc protease
LAALLPRTLLLTFILLASPAFAMTIERVVSPGGIEAWLVEDHTMPVISVEVAFAGGAATDPHGKPGLANMASDLLDEGAGDLDSQAYQRRVEDLASTVRFNVTQDNWTASLRSLTKNFAPTMCLLRLSLAEPRFDAPAVDRVRSQLLVSLSRKSETPQSVASRVWWRNAFGEHPYGRPSEGTPEVVQAITAGELRQVVKERLARNVMTVGVVGDITAADLAPLLDQTFGTLPAEAAPATIPEASAGNPGSLLLVKKAIPQSVVTFGEPGIKRDDPDWYIAYVMNYILGGGGFTSRLTEEVREKRGLAYGVYSYLYPLKHAGVILGGVATQNARVGESIGIIREEWRRLANEGPSEDELTNAKTYLTGSFPLQFDSTSRIAALIVDIQQQQLGIDYLEKRNALIEAVTLADVKRVAKRLLDANALSFVVVGTPGDLPGAREVPDGGF